VLLQGGLKLGGLGGFDHLGEGFDELALRAVQVRQFMVHEVLECMQALHRFISSVVVWSPEMTPATVASDFKSLGFAQV
jgi:hypothetical protein